MTEYDRYVSVQKATYAARVRTARAWETSAPVAPKLLTREEFERRAKALATAQAA